MSSLIPPLLRAPHSKKIYIYTFFFYTALNWTVDPICDRFKLILSRATYISRNMLITLNRSMEGNSWIHLTPIRCVCVERQNQGRILNTAPLHHVRKHNHHQSNYSGDRVSTWLSLYCLAIDVCIEIDDQLYSSEFFYQFNIFKTPGISYLCYLVFKLLHINTQRLFKRLRWQKVFAKDVILNIFCHHATLWLKCLEFNPCNSNRILNSLKKKHEK